MKPIVDDLILKWAQEKRIIGRNGKGTPLAQAEKTIEEAEELKEAIEISVKGAGAIRLEIGDIYVTICIQAAMQGFTLEQCAWAAYDKIKNRQGQMVDGQFVREKE